MRTTVTNIPGFDKKRSEGISRQFRKKKPRKWREND